MLKARLRVQGRVGQSEQALRLLAGFCQTAVPLTGSGTWPLTIGAAGGWPAR